MFHRRVRYAFVDFLFVRRSFFFVFFVVAVVIQSRLAASRTLSTHIRQLVFMSLAGPRKKNHFSRQLTHQTSSPAPAMPRPGGEVAKTNGKKSARDKRAQTITPPYMYLISRELRKSNVDAITLPYYLCTIDTVE